MQLQSSLRSWELAATPTVAIERLLTDLGVRHHPHIEARWTAVRGALALSGGEVLAAPTRTALVRLGTHLIDLRPARQADVVAVWRRLPVPLERLVLRPLHLHVRASDPHGLTVSVDGEVLPLDPDAPLPGALAERVRVLVDGLGPAESALVTVHLADLHPSDLHRADTLTWESLLADCTPGRGHLVREVATAGPPPVGDRLDYVGFLGDIRKPSADHERRWVTSVWGAGVRVGQTRADLLHVHAHGHVGAVGGVDLDTLRARVVLFNACEGALSGGVVRRMVATGRAADSLGFPEAVYAETTLALSLSVHPTLHTWRDDWRRGVVLAALDGRRALGHRPSALSWRHYRAVGPSAPVPPAQAAP